MAINDDVILLGVPIGHPERNGIENGHSWVLGLPRLPWRRNTGEKFWINRGGRCSDLSLRAAPENCKCSSDGSFLDEPNGYCILLRLSQQRLKGMNQMGTGMATLPSLLRQQDEVGPEPVQQPRNTTLRQLPFFLSSCRIDPLAPLKECPVTSKNRVSETPMSEIKRKHNRIVDAELHGRR